MTTIIDALVVTLGLDASNFVKGQRDSDDAMKKFAGSVKRSSGDVERQAKAMTESFGGLERQLLKMATLFTGGLGIVAFVGNLIKTTTEVSRLSTTFGTSAREMLAWQQMGRQVGATAEEITSSYTTMARALSAFKFFPGAQLPLPIMRFFQSRGVEFYKPNGQPQEQTQMFTQIFRALNDPQHAKMTALEKETAVLGLPGMTPGVARLFTQSKSVDEFQRGFEKILQDIKESEEDLKKFERTNAEFNKEFAKTENLFRLIGSQLLPVINAVLKVFGEAIQTDIEDVRKLIDAFDRFDRWFASTWIGRMAAKLLGEPADKKPSSFGERFGAGDYGPQGTFGGRPATGPGSGAFKGNTGGGSGGGSDSGANVPSQKFDAQREEVKRGVAQQFRDSGTPESGVAAILANVQRESGFNPNLRHPDQPKFGGEAHFAHGLYQEGGTEWNNYSKWLSQKYPGRAWQDPKLQTEFLIENLKKNYPKVWAGLNDPNMSAGQKAMLFQRGYLKPAQLHSGDAALAERYLRNPPASPQVADAMKHPSVAGMPGGGGGGSDSGAANFKDRWGQWPSGANSPSSDGWGQNVRAIPWLQKGGMSMIKGIPSPTTNNSSTSETHIGSFTVNTESRSNPYGMAAQIKDAVQRAGIMDNSNSGPN